MKCTTKKGAKASGTYKGKEYRSGVLYTGVKNNVRYANGEKFSGLDNGIYYDEGQPLTGEQGGLYYVDGTLFSGVTDQSYYLDGAKPVGYVVHEGILYCDGDIETATVRVLNVWYAGGKIANGSIVTADGEQLYVKNGIEVVEDEDVPSMEPDDEPTSPPDESRGYELMMGKLYYNGQLAAGTQLYNKVLYKNGTRATGIDFYANRYYDGGVLANGLIRVGHQQLYVVQGKLFSGVKDYVEYEQGQPVSDYYYASGMLYYKGQPNVGVVRYKEKWFNGPVLANGLTMIHGVETMLQQGVKVSGLWNDVYYSDGFRFTGVAHKILYTNGVRETGRKWYGGQFFVDGQQVEGIFIENGLYYVNGALANGRYDVPALGIRYLVDGQLANGLVHGIYYKDGQRLRGFSVINGKLYHDGMPNVGVKRFDGLWYANQYVANGVIFTATGEEYAVEHGRGITGYYQFAYYVNGKLEEGYVLRGGELYSNGRPHNNLVEYEGVWYARTKPAHGIHTIQNVTYCFDNGQKYTGMYQERYFVDGRLAQGEYGGKTYVDGIEQP